MKESLLRVSGFLVLSIASLLVIKQARPQAPPTRGASVTSIDIRKDGTATAVGIVLENKKRCQVDGECSLRLEVLNQPLVVIYGPAEGEGSGNPLVLKQGFGVQKNDRVKVHGRYNKGRVPTIDVYSSNDFYILTLPEVK